MQIPVCLRLNLPTSHHLSFSVLYQSTLCDYDDTTLFFQWGRWVRWIDYSGFVLTPFHSTPILTSSPVSEPLSYLTLVRLSLLLRLSPSVSFRISTTRVWWMGSMPWWQQYTFHHQNWRGVRHHPEDMGDGAVLQNIKRCLCLLSVRMHLKHGYKWTL